MQFLLRHVYASTIAAFRLSKFQASFLTFLLSACIHELVMVSSSFHAELWLDYTEFLAFTPGRGQQEIPIVLVHDADDAVANDHAW
jgi:hypothetical protein